MKFDLNECLLKDSIKVSGTLHFFCIKKCFCSSQLDDVHLKSIIIGIMYYEWELCIIKYICKLILDIISLIIGFKKKQESEIWLFFKLFQ